MNRKIKDLALWLVWFPLRSILCHLPINLNYRLASLVSGTAFYGLRSRRRIAEEELALLFGDKFSESEKRLIVRRSFRNFLLRQVENLFFDRFDKQVLFEFVSIEGLDNLHDSVREGKGTIILLCHFGSFLMPLPVLGHLGYKVHQVAGKPLIEEYESIRGKIFKLRKSITDRMPFDFLLTNEYLGPVVKALKRNEIILLAFDGRTASKWVEVPLFNRTALISPGPFNLARKTGARILPTFVVRGRDDRHRVIFEPMMELKTNVAQRDNFREHCVTYTKIMERYLAAFPCHFLMTMCTVRKEASLGLNMPLFRE